ncbi:MAG: hypothetical protein HY319_16025 [Armatimonadetes bacterium]|nr:hypothetical protein [Armatimonadota bacterium]
MSVPMTDELLLVLYNSMLQDESRYDVLRWAKEKSDQIKEQIREKKESGARLTEEDVDVEPAQVLSKGGALESLCVNGLAERKMGTLACITPAGIDYIEKNGFLDAKEYDRILRLRQTVLEAIDRICKESPSRVAQFGKVLAETRMGRNEVAPTIRFLQTQEWVYEKDTGFFALTQSGAVALEDLTSRFAPTDKERAAQAGGPVDLASINFFDDLF